MCKLIKILFFAAYLQEINIHAVLHQYLDQGLFHHVPTQGMHILPFVSLLLSLFISISWVSVDPLRYFWKFVFMYVYMNKTFEDFNYAFRYEFMVLKPT